MNLIEPIKIIHDKAVKLNEEKEREIKKVTEHYNGQIEELLLAKKTLIEMNTACFECNGTGKIVVCTGQYEDRGTREKCDKCGGTGTKQRGDE